MRSNKKYLVHGVIPNSVSARINKLRRNTNSHRDLRWATFQLDRGRNFTNSGFFQSRLIPNWQYDDARFIKPRTTRSTGPR